MGSFAGSCEIVEEKDLEGRRKQREYHGSVEYDIDKLFQSISLKQSLRLMTSSFHNTETSYSAGPSRTTSPSMRMSPRVFGVSDSLSLKQSLRDRCVSKASEMAALKRVSKSAAASPRFSEGDRIKSLYNQVSNNRSGFVVVDKGKASLVETSLIELDENVASTSAHTFVKDDVKEIDKHVTSLPCDSTSGTEKSNVVRKVTRMIPRPKQKPKKKILLKKKLKIGIVSVTKATNKNEETDGSLDSTASKLLCQRCHCSLKSTSIDTTSHNLKLSADSLSSLSNSIGTEAHQVANENSSSSCNVTKQDVSSSNDSGNVEFSLSSKDSLVGDYSRSTTSMSEETNLSRFSCGNKPHMSMDVRWESIKHAKLQHGSLGLRHFNLLKKLGCGDIGTVYLAELIGTNCLFAIKVMDNEFLARRKKSPRAQAERDILKMLDHPFLPTLYAQFSSDHLSCLVMEYCPGGDLHVLRQKQMGRCFPEPAARFYVAEILLALEYLHMLGIIYRDLKPENILVREDGHIMLTDFDLSLRCTVNPTLHRSISPPGNDPARTSDPYKASNCIQPCHASCFSPRLSTNQQQQLQKPKRALPQLVAEPTEARSNSFVGTHEYLAPEIIRGEGHGAAVDWWTFGVLLYELLYGKTPFKGYNNDKTLANIVLQSLKFPDSPEVSFRAKDLIRGLLVKEPENRLGSEKGSAEIKRHPFFEGLNWALIRCAIPPELPEVYEFGGGQEAGGDDNRYLECKAIGDHLEFELF